MIQIKKIGFIKIFKFILFLAFFIEMIFMSQNITFLNRLLYLIHLAFWGIAFIWYKPRVWEKTDFTWKSLKKISFFIVIYYLVGFVVLSSYSILFGQCTGHNICSFLSFGFLTTVFLWPLAIIGVIANLIHTLLK